MTARRPGRTTVATESNLWYSLSGRQPRWKSEIKLVDEVGAQGIGHHLWRPASRPAGAGPGWPVAALTWRTAPWSNVPSLILVVGLQHQRTRLADKTPSLITAYRVIAMLEIDHLSPP